MNRDILAHRGDRSLTIIASGDMQNIHELWSSPPDYISGLSGEDLMTRKLKRLIVVAGNFPTGREYNFYVNSTRAAIFNRITNSLPVTFIGSEVGDQIMIGQNILEKPESDPVRDAFHQYYSLWGLNSRPAWTGPALLLATRGYEDNGVPLFNRTKGRVTIDPATGSNTWVNLPESNQEYLTLAQPVRYYADLFDALLMRKQMSGGAIRALIPDENGNLKVFNLTNPENPALETVIQS
jgi:hypothetical protein